MARAKKRGALLFAGLMSAALLLALLTGDARAWGATIGMGVGLALTLAAPIDDDPAVRNNRFKLPLLIASGLFGAAFLGWGAVTGELLEIVIGALMLLLSLPSIWVVRRGRNPWWVRGWVDYW